jgi:hypothetical protein
MSRMIMTLVSGVVVGLAVGLSTDSTHLVGPGQSLDRRKEEAVYQGRPASFWIRQLKDKDSSLRQQAMWALSRLGPTQEGVVTALAAMLKDKSEGVRFDAAVNLGRMGRKQQRRFRSSSLAFTIRSSLSALAPCAPWQASAQMMTRCLQL